MAKVKAEDLATEEQRNERTSIAVPMPRFMRAEFERLAKESDVVLGPYVRDFLAKQLGITLPEIATKRRSKYASEEEKKAAQKAAAQARKDLINSLLAEHRARIAANAAASDGNSDGANGNSDGATEPVREGELATA